MSNGFSDETFAFFMAIRFSGFTALKPLHRCLLHITPEEEEP